MEEFYKDSTNAILAALKVMGKKNLVWMSSWFTDPGRRENPAWEWWKVIPGLEPDLTLKFKMEGMI
jgi:hypothetical protein